MNDENLMRHLETDHADDLVHTFLAEPGRTERRLTNSSTWRAYHDAMHRLYPRKYDHGHTKEEPVGEMKTHKDVEFTERTETVWVVADGGGVYVSEEAAQQAHPSSEVEEATLYRPSLEPIYGGATLKEALWSEMDRLMEALMTGAVAEDGGDKFRAQELAWVIAIVSNPYAPSVDAVRAEAMRRWNEGDPQAQAEFDSEVGA